MSFLSFARDEHRCAVYGVELTPDDGRPIFVAGFGWCQRFVYIGASSDDGVDGRLEADREGNYTYNTCVAAGWRRRILFCDRGLPVGAEDYATLVLTVWYSRIRT